MKKERPIDRALRWCKQLDMDQSEFAKRIGVLPQHITNWKRRGMPPEHYISVAKALKHSVDELLGLEPETSKISDTSGSYRRIRGVPVVGTAQVGKEGLWTETEHAVGSGEGFIEMPSDDRNAYAVRVVGDSMHPRIKSGEFVVVEPNHAVVAGDEVLVVTKDGRSMVKELAFRRNGQVALNSVNNGHSRLTFSEEEIEKIHYVAAISKVAFFRIL